MTINNRPSSQAPDPYTELGVDRSATADDIKAAYRRRVKTEHPDAGGDAERFGAIVRAYGVLSDDGKRARYDATGEIDDKPDNREAALMGRLSSLLATFLSRPDAIHSDLASRMRAHVIQEIANGQRIAKHLKLEIEHLEEVASRFHRAEGPNLLRKAVEGQAAEKRRAIVSVEAQIAELEELRTVLADYSFEPKPVTIVVRGGFTGSNSSGTWT